MEKKRPQAAKKFSKTIDENQDFFWSGLSKVWITVQQNTSEKCWGEQMNKNSRISIHFQEESHSKLHMIEYLFKICMS